MKFPVQRDFFENLFNKIKDFIIPSEANNFKSKFMESNVLLILVALLLVLKISTVLFFVRIPQNIFFADITKVALENFANQTRQSVGLQPLVENIKLQFSLISFKFISIRKFIVSIYLTIKYIYRKLN